MKGPNQKLVLVEWVDSCSAAGVWNDPTDLPDNPKTCFSVGWIVKESKSFLQIVSSAGLNDTDGFDHVSGDMIIPRGCIVRTKVLSRRRL